MPYLGFSQDVQIGVQKVSFKLYILLYIYAEIKGTNLKLLEVSLVGKRIRLSFCEWGYVKENAQFLTFSAYKQDLIIILGFWVISNPSLPTLAHVS